MMTDGAHHCLDCWITTKIHIDDDDLHPLGAAVLDGQTRKRLILTTTLMMVTILTTTLMMMVKLTSTLVPESEVATPAKDSRW